MEHEFWYNAWKKEKQGWQQTSVNAHLITYWQRFESERKSKVFVPLCGQSLDMLWLNQQGHEVVGNELDDGAVENFYGEHKIKHKISQNGRIQTYTSTRLTIHSGDYFDLQPRDLAGVNLVFDRAALIALPSEMRKDYVNQLHQLLPTGCKLFLITMVYDESRMSGPPFSVLDDEVYQLYNNGFNVEKIASSSDPKLLGGLAKRGLQTLEENVFFLTTMNDHF